MAITKCRISAQTVRGFTVAARALRQCGRTSDWMVHAGLMEKIMSKTSYGVPATSERELTEAELDAVAGGNWAWAAVIVIAVGDALTDGAVSKPLAQWALNGGHS
jgi:hypothetical protein